MRDLYTLIPGVVNSRFVNQSWVADTVFVLNYSAAVCYLRLADNLPATIDNYDFQIPPFTALVIPTNTAHVTAALQALTRTGNPISLHQRCDIWLLANEKAPQLGALNLPNTAPNLLEWSAPIPHTLSAWALPTLVGAGSSVALDGNISWQSSNSIVLSAQDNAINSSAMLWKRLSIYGPTRVVIRARISVDPAWSFAVRFGFVTTPTVGTTVWDSYVQNNIQLGANVIFVPTGATTRPLDVYTTFWGARKFDYYELVLDVAGDTPTPISYVRAQVNDRSYDLANIPPPNGAASAVSAPYVYAMVINQTPGAGNIAQAWIGDMSVYRNAQ